VDRFNYPDQRSQFETLATSEYDDDGSGFFARRRTSAGYNVCAPPFHVIGLHLGVPTPVLHRRQTNEKIYLFQFGDVFFAPSGAPIQYAHPDPIDTLYIYLSPNFVDGVGESIGLARQQFELQEDLGTHDPVIARIGNEALSELMEPGLGGQLYIDALKTQLAVHLIRRYTGSIPPALAKSPSPPRRDLRAAVDYIHTHLNQHLTLHEIAAVEYLTPFHFSRLFKQLYGVSPHQYVIRKRVEKAAELLRNPRLSISDVALEAGFTDHSHLTRHFKRLMGKSPRAARQERTQKPATT
jgi:AraC family transcriptional regulator